MESKIKEVIRRISKTDISIPIDVLGNTIADILFKEGTSALYVNNEVGLSFLLLSTETKSKKKHESILLLTELVAVLRNLEEQGVIYVDDDCSLPKDLFYQGKVIFEKDQKPGVYKISNNLTLNCQDEQNITMNAKGKELMTSTVVYDQVGKPLARYLCSYVFPTMSLKNYVERRFRTREERNTHLGLRYSVISMTIAVIIATISPFLSVIIANRYGFSTIRHDQMDSILKVAKPVYVVNRKDCVHQSDNIISIQKSQKGKEYGK